MGEIVPLQDPLNYARVLQRIRKLWKEGEIEILPHAQERMNERKITTADIQRVINSGEITEHESKVQWRYTVKGKTIDGIQARCIVEIENRLIIITVILDERRKTPRGR